MLQKVECKIVLFLYNNAYTKGLLYEKIDIFSTELSLTNRKYVT